MTTIRLRNGTAAAWTAANPTLAAGEVGVETDTGKQKVGNGTQAWNALAYSGASGLLAVKQHAPNPAVLYSTPSTTSSDVDATNLAVTFTVPASGKVLIRLNARMAMYALTGAGERQIHFVLRTTGGADVAGTAMPVMSGRDGSGEGTAMVFATIYRTGLTPGASVTYRWGWFLTVSGGSPTGGQVDFIAGGTNAGDNPAIMEVWAAP